jgi:putative ABC transport system permease protein
MWRNYLISAYRNLLRNKGYAILNILGLALGIGCSIVMFSYIHLEQQTDKHHANYDRIYRVYTDSDSPSYTGKFEVVPHPLGKAIKEETSAFEAVARIYYYGGTQLSYYHDDDVKHIEQGGIIFSESSLFDIFSVDFLAGTPNLDDLNTVVISRDLAEKLFDTKDLSQIPGKVISMDNKANVTIMGVFENLPDETDYPFELVGSYETQAAINDYFGKGELWERYNGMTGVLLLLPEGGDAVEAERQASDVHDAHKVNEWAAIGIQPLSDVHYNAEIGSWYGQTLSKELLWTLRLIAILLILTSSINFVNLTTAKATNRSKEVGVRKVMGSSIPQLIGQHLTETLIIVVISLIIGLAASELIFQFINPILNKSMSLFNLSTGWLISFCLSLVFIITLLSGLYPAYIIASFQPVDTLKSRLGIGQGSGKFNLRRVLVVLQFAISLSLLVGAYVAISQQQFLIHSDMGFRQQGVISIPLPKIDAEKTQLLQTKISELSQVELVSAHLASPMGRTNNQGDLYLAGEENPSPVKFNFKNIDENYFNLFNLDVLAGRTLGKNEPRENILISQTAVSQLGINSAKEAIGRELKADWGSVYHIIGVVSDFHTNSLRENKMAVLFDYNSNYFYELAVLLKSITTADIAQSLDNLREVWVEVYPEYLFRYDFLDDMVKNNYQTEMAITKLMGFFTMVAILIAGLGLYGLVDYIAIRRVKEIGIRKVLGATKMAILKIFSKELTILVLVAAAISFPLMYILMNKWLENYAYSIEITPFVFIISFLLVVVVVLVTTGYRALMAASINPAQTLKDE